MITINETFEDSEFERLKRVKDLINFSWHDLLLKVFDDEYERLRSKSGGADEQHRNKSI